MIPSATTCLSSERARGCSGRPLFFCCNRRHVQGERSGHEPSFGTVHLPGQHPHATTVPPAGAAIAVVGAGVSGLVCAHYLQRRYRVTLIEAAPRLGGHTNTVAVRWAGERYAIDTGFIVFNDRTYPRFRGLLDELAVLSQPSEMSFSVRCERTGVEYCGSGLRGLFAQRRNLVRPWFYGMLGDIHRFHREAPALLRGGGDGLTVDDYLREAGFGRAFGSHYLLPMGSAIWSARADQMRAMPISFVVRFFHNHGMLAVRGRPTWHVVRGGAKTYVDALLQRFRGELLLSTPVTRVQRQARGVRVHTARGPRDFDAAVLATHSDRSLALLADPSASEQRVLAAVPYQENDAVLHVDERMLPRRQAARAAWNYHLHEGADHATVTYDLTRLQQLSAPVRFCVTLNRAEGIAADRVLHRARYAHPVFTVDGLRQRALLPRINGGGGVWLCGAWCGYGFHEDGVRAALAVCRALGVDEVPLAEGDAA